VIDPRDANQFGWSGEHGPLRPAPEASPVRPPDRVLSRLWWALLFAAGVVFLAACAALVKVARPAW
jgi:hypothetical protein